MNFVIKIIVNFIMSFIRDIIYKARKTSIDRVIKKETKDVIESKKKSDKLVDDFERDLERYRGKH